MAKTLSGTRYVRVTAVPRHAPAGVGSSSGAFRSPSFWVADRLVLPHPLDSIPVKLQTKQPHRAPKSPAEEDRTCADTCLFEKWPTK